MFNICTLLQLLFRFKETPNDVEDDVLFQSFGFRMADLKDGHVADEAIQDAHNEYGKYAKFSPSGFYNTSDSEKVEKARQLEELGLKVYV